MVLTESIRSLAKQATFVISAHTALLVINSYAHEKIDLIYSLTPYMPLLLFLCLAPLVVVFFLSTQSARPGAVVLLGILPAILIYNIVARFTALPPITRQEPSLIWKILYEGSFGLVLVLEVIAFWLAFKLLREIHTQINVPTENVPK
jgi:FtsH-binding integral membrane protein